MRMEKQSRGEVFKRGGRVAVDDDGFEAECLACCLRVGAIVIVSFTLHIPRVEQ